MSEIPFGSKLHRIFRPKPRSKGAGRWWWHIDAAPHVLARAILAKETASETRWRAAGELDMRLRRETGLRKAPAVAAYVRMIVESGEKVVLCGWHRDVYALWIHLFSGWQIPVYMYTGSEDAKAKDASVADFVRTGRPAVFILSLRAGAGLDGLQHAKCEQIVFGELDWSPQVHAQNIGRLHRDGQTGNVVAHVLVANTGSDPVVVDILGIKRMQAAGIEDPFGSELAPVPDAQRGAKLARAYLESLGITPETQEVAG